MNKKIISILIVATIIFMCVFAACDKGTYTNPATGEKYKLVTDENGEKILNDDGELLVYVTDENGRRVKNENGEYETEVHGFIGQIEEDGVVEDYAYKLTLPKGWKTTDEKGVFENKSEEQKIVIDIKDMSYDDYKKIIKDIYVSGKKQNIDVTLEEDLDFLDGAQKLCRLVVNNNGGMLVVLLFENSNNVYEIVLQPKEPYDEAISDLTAFCENLEFKNFTYYEQTTESVPYYTGTPTTVGQ